MRRQTRASAASPAIASKRGRTRRRRPSPARPNRRIGRRMPDRLTDPAEPGSGEVTATVVVAAPVEKVYQAFVAWERQSEWIPMTTVRLVSGDGGQGSLGEAVKKIGRAGIRDEMRADRLGPPCEVRGVHC